MHRTALIAALLLAGCSTYSTLPATAYSQAIERPPETPPVPPGWESSPPRLVLPPPERRGNGPPYGDPLGDVWEEEEENAWRGTWIRRGQSRLFDAYWVHSSGERVLAVVEIVSRGRDVDVIRRHGDGQECTYRGTIEPDWVEVRGWYSCSWNRHSSPWRARIVRMRDVSPALLANGGWRRTQ